MPVKRTIWRKIASLVLPGLILAGMMGGCAGQPPTRAGRAEPAIPLQPCQIGRQDGSERMAAKCGTLTVSENRAAGSGRQIDLHIAVISAISRNPAPDPVFFITGGPGQAATEDYVSFAGAFRRINEKRDIVLVDQRGTGQSQPLLCPAADSAQDNAAWTAACLKQLAADPRFYTTLQAIEDLDQVRQVLGYEQINLYGLSYGTRVAQSYLRQYPQRTRSVILDGVVPQDEALGLTLSSDAQRTLDMIFLRCAADTACRNAFPDLRSEFAGLLSRLDQAPARLTIDHPTTGVPIEINLTRDRLALAVRLFSYQTETTALLPMLIHDAAKTGDFSRLAAQSLIVTQQLEGSLNTAMHNSVVCTEDVPFYRPAGVLATDGEVEKQGYLGEAYRQLEQVCSVWPVAEVPDGYKQLVTSDVPVLLLSGEADPVTPPANAERVAASLKRSADIIVPGQGHGVILRGCTSRRGDGFHRARYHGGAADGVYQRDDALPVLHEQRGAMVRGQGHD